MNTKPILFHDIDGVLFGEYDGEFQLRPGVKTWLKWAHERFEIVWLTAWSPEKIGALLNVVYSEKFLKSAPAPPVRCADWSACSSKVEWLSWAIQKLQGRQWCWIDDEVSAYEKEIEKLKLPKERCIHVSAKDAGALTETQRSLEELRDGLKRLVSEPAEIVPVTNRLKALRFPVALVLSVVCLAVPALAPAQVQTFTATHTYILGDHDSKDDARQRCLLEAKRKILERAGVYIESESEVKNFDLTKDTITSFAAAVMQVKDTKEDVSFQQGHISLTLKLTAQVDLAEMRKQLAARHVDAGVREDVAAQKERIRRLEAQLETMIRRQQGEQSSGHAPDFPPIDIPADILQTWHTQAAQGNADAQNSLGWLYATGQGAPQDYVEARRWYEQAAAQGDAQAQHSLGWLYANGNGVPKDNAKAAHWFEKAAAQGIADAQGVLALMYEYGQGVPKNDAKARMWYEKAAAGRSMDAQNHLGSMYYFGEGVPKDYAKAAQWWEQAAAQGYARAQNNLGMLYANGNGVPQDDVRAYFWHNFAAAHSEGDLQKLSANNRDKVARRMTPAQIAEAQRLSQQCQAQQFKGC